MVFGLSCAWCEFDEVSERKSTFFCPVIVQECSQSLFIGEHVDEWAFYRIPQVQALYYASKVTHRDIFHHFVECRLKIHTAGRENTWHSLSLSEDIALITGSLFLFRHLTIATRNFLNQVASVLAWLTNGECFFIVLRSVQLCCQFYLASNEPRNKESVSRHNEFGL